MHLWGRRRVGIMRRMKEKEMGKGNRKRKWEKEMGKGKGKR